VQWNGNSIVLHGAVLVVQPSKTVQYTEYSIIIHRAIKHYSIVHLVYLQYYSGVQ